MNYTFSFKPPIRTWDSEALALCKLQKGTFGDLRCIGNELSWASESTWTHYNQKAADFMGLRGQSPVVDRSSAFITLLLTRWDKVNCFWTSTALSLSYLHEWKIHSMVYFFLVICWKNSFFQEISVLLIHFRYKAFTKQTVGHESYLTAPRNETS